jgi:hypothetical protein
MSDEKESFQGKGERRSRNKQGVDNNVGQKFGTKNDSLIQICSLREAWEVWLT